MGLAGFRLHSALASAEILAQEVPIGLPRVSAGGPDPDRILLFGSDVFMGRGVLSHDLALPGQLARAVSAITGRGIDVQLHTRATMLVSEAIHAVDEVNLERYDAILISIGLTDAMASTRPAEWKQCLAELLTKLESGITSSTHVFILKRPTSTTVPLFKSHVGRQLAQSFIAFDRETDALLESREWATALQLPSYRHTEPERFHTPSDFAAYAAAMAPEVAEQLDRYFDGGAPRSEAIASETRRQASVDGLGILDTAREERFDRIVARTRSMFGTKYAAFNLIDHDRRWTKASIGSDSVESPRTSEFCNTTIHHRGAFIVGNASEDSHFAQNPLVAGDPHIRFYAGYPIEAPDGERVGSLCVYDPEPRQVTPFEEVGLRELALLIEKELWLPRA